MDGATLSRRWKVTVRQALYSKTGNWYHHLTSFPGALFDPEGYLFFETEQDYRSCSSLNINKDIWVPHGISSDLAYVRVVIDGAESVPNSSAAATTKEGRVHYEGTPVSVNMTVYERDRGARLECLKHYGYLCSVCQFDFFRTYGEIGTDMIHVHHLTPVSHISETHVVNPIRDLRPICPNCHAVIHRRQPPFSIEEVKKMIDVRGT
jgi:predicted HNH restriction endonuclease